MPRRRDQELLRDVGRRVGQARRDRGWTQDALSEAIGIEAVTLSRLETGDRALSLSTLASIADVLQVRLGDLVDMERGLIAPETAPDEAELLRLYGQLPPARRELVLKLARELGS